jgi:hypothetical protein
MTDMTDAIWATAYAAGKAEGLREAAAICLTGAHYPRDAITRACAYALVGNLVVATETRMAYKFHDGILAQLKEPQL